MSTADAAWLRMDRPTNLMIVNSVLWFDDPVDWERCKAVFLDRIVARFDRFRQRATNGLPLASPHWEDDPGFDPALHFHHVALPAPHDRAALQDFIGDRIATPLDHSRPLWEVYLIDDFGSGCAILVRIHHSIADGIALARVMLTLTDGGEPGAGIAEAGAGNGSRLAGLGSLARAAVQEGVETLLHPDHARELAAGATGDAQTLAKLLLPGSDPETAIKGDQSIAHRVAWSQPVALWRVKRAAPRPRRDGQRRARRRGHRRGRPSPPRRGRRGRRGARARPLQPPTARRPLPRELGNRFGLVLLGLPVGIDDPSERLAEVKRRMDAIKHSHEGAFAFGILGLMGRTPVQVEALLIDYFTAKGSMVLTNVPGPRRRLSLAGTPLAGVLVWAPCSGTVGMSVSVFSYAGKVTVGFLTDAGLVPDPQALADTFRDELLALARAA